jgi:hypothetical protein
MKTRALIVAAAVFALILSGCGGGSSSPSFVTVDIQSEGGNFDGDIIRDGLSTTFSVETQATVDNILVGTSPNVTLPSLTDESRGYLTFSLAQIPAGAAIQDARLFLMINDVSVSSGSSVLVTPSMVSFGALNTLGSSAIQNLFNNAEILTSPVSYDIFPGDIGFDSPLTGIDVTDALIEARTRGWSTLQIKLIGSFGWIVFDDLTFPPVMTVDYVI